MTQLEQRLLRELEKERELREILQKELIKEMHISMKELQKEFIGITQPLIDELREKVSQSVKEKSEEKDDTISHLEKLSLEMNTIIKLLQQNSTDKKTEESLQELFTNLQEALSQSLRDANKDLILEIKQSNKSLTEVINQF